MKHVRRMSLILVCVLASANDACESERGKEPSDMPDLGAEFVGDARLDAYSDQRGDGKQLWPEGPPLSEPIELSPNPGSRPVLTRLPDGQILVSWDRPGDYGQPHVGALLLALPLSGHQPAELAGYFEDASFAPGLVVVGNAVWAAWEPSSELGPVFGALKPDLSPVAETTSLHVADTGPTLSLSVAANPAGGFALAWQSSKLGPDAPTRCELWAATLNEAGGLEAGPVCVDPRFWFNDTLEPEPSWTSVGAPAIAWWGEFVLVGTRYDTWSSFMNENEGVSARVYTRNMIPVSDYLVSGFGSSRSGAGVLAISRIMILVQQHSLIIAVPETWPSSYSNYWHGLLVMLQQGAKQQLERSSERRANLATMISVAELGKGLVAVHNGTICNGSVIKKESRYDACVELLNSDLTQNQPVPERYLKKRMAGIEASVMALDDRRFLLAYEVLVDGVSSVWVVEGEDRSEHSPTSE